MPWPEEVPEGAIGTRFGVARVSMTPSGISEHHAPIAPWTLGAEGRERYTDHRSNSGVR